MSVWRSEENLWAVLLLLHGSWGSNPDQQARWQSPLLDETSLAHYLTFLSLTCEVDTAVSSPSACRRSLGVMRGSHTMVLNFGEYLHYPLF